MRTLDPVQGLIFRAYFAGVRGILPLAAGVFAEVFEEGAELLYDVRMLSGDVLGFSQVAGQVVKLRRHWASVFGLFASLASSSLNRRDELPLSLPQSQPIGVFDEVLAALLRFADER